MVHMSMHGLARGHLAVAIAMCIHHAIWVYRDFGKLPYVRLQRVLTPHTLSPPKAPLNPDKQAKAGLYEAVVRGGRRTHENL